MSLNKKIFSLSLLLVTASAVAEPRLELDEIVVSASYENETLRDMPRSVAVISAEDIAQAPAGNLIELLAREANVSLRTFTSGDKFGGVDIRGMGDASSSNVVVMVDGLRLNASDHSGADFSSIPLSQIKRIEIIRGASAVRYGNGAVGGVINIITDAANADRHSHVFSEAGSYATYDVRAATRQVFDEFSLAANIAGYNSDGYRDNSELNKRDGQLTLQYFVSAESMVKFSASAHHDEYGLPGPVSLSDFLASEAARQNSAAAEDGGATDDVRYQFAADLDFAAAGFMQASVAQRHRENPYIIGFNAAISEADQQANISEDATQLDVTHEWQTGQIKWLLGMNAYLADYARSENGSDVVDQSKIGSGDVQDASLFFNVSSQITPQLVLRAGMRRGQFDLLRREQELHQVCEYINVEVPPGSGIFIPVEVPGSCSNQWQTVSDVDNAWNNRAAEAGLNYQINTAVDMYLAWSSSYRNPNVDELAEATADLHPQSGRHVESGVRFSASKRLEVAYNVFYMRVEDEIFYGESASDGTPLNRNAEEDTRRIGGELELKYALSSRWYVWSNLGYTDAEFVNSHNTIPLVAALTFSAGAEWSPHETWLLALGADYVGERFDGNDVANENFEKLSAYSVFNGKISWRKKSLVAHVGINNLFDEVYATSAYSESYYPMPGRQVYAGIRYDF